MKTRALSMLMSVSLPVAGAVMAQTTTTDRASAPTFINAEVVRVDTRAETITFASAGGETMLTVDSEAVAGLGQVRPGDKVILAVRTAEEGERQVVTEIRSASPISGTPAARSSTGLTTIRPSSSGLATAAGAQGARPETPGLLVVSVDARRQSLVVLDDTGATQTLPVSARAASRLRSLRPGDRVLLDFQAGHSAAGTKTVSGIQILPLPSLVGEVIRIDRPASTVTLRTAQGDVVLPAREQAATLFRLRLGERVSVTYRADAAGSIQTVTEVRRLRADAVLGAGSVPAPFRGTTRATSDATGVISATGGRTIAIAPATVSATGLTAEQLAHQRALATQTLTTTIEELAPQVNDMNLLWARYRDTCLRDRYTITTREYPQGREWFALLDGTTVTDPERMPNMICRQMLVDAVAKAGQLGTQVTAAVEQALRSEVLPGTIRSTLEASLLDYAGWSR